MCEFPGLQRGVGVVEVQVDCVGTVEGWRILITSSPTLEEQSHSGRHHERSGVKVCSERRDWCRWWPGVPVKKGLAAEHLETLLAQKVAAFPETKA